MHQVERAIFDLRRGLPVVILDDASGHQPITLVYPLESVADPDLQALAEQSGSQPALTLTRHRMAAMGHPISTSAASLPLSGRLLLSSDEIYRAATGESIQSDLYADPRPASPGERAALALMRRALLVPAAVTASIEPGQRSDIARAIERGELLAVQARAAEQCFELGGGLLRRISEAEVPLANAPNSRFVLFREPDGLREHIAVMIGDTDHWPDAVPVRLHSACLTGDLFDSLRCDCGEQLRTSIASIEAMGGGVLLYLAQEGRGIGLANKLRAYALQDQGMDTVEADQALGFGEDERRYGVAVDMLRSLDIGRIHLLTNNPLKVDALSAGGIDVVDQDRVFGSVTRQNRRYLNAKASRSGHLLQELLGEP